MANSGRCITFTLDGAEFGENLKAGATTSDFHATRHKCPPFIQNNWEAVYFCQIYGETMESHATALSSFDLIYVQASFSVLWQFL